MVMADVQTSVNQREDIHKFRHAASANFPVTVAIRKREISRAKFAKLAKASQPQRHENLIS